MPKSQAQLHRGAVLFSQRCSGCHTLSYAATHGSAANLRTATLISGPNFNVRCERPDHPRPVRDQQRRLLGRLHAPERRRRPGRGRRGEVRRHLRRTRGAQAARASLPATARPIGTLPPPPGSATATAAASASSTTHGDGNHGRERHHHGAGGRAKKQGGATKKRRPRTHSEGRAVLDIRLIRRDPDAVRAALAPPRTAGRRRASTACSSSTSAGARSTTELEALRAEQNQASRALKGAPSEEQRAQLAELAARGRSLSDEETSLRAQRDAALAALPNLPAADAPARGRGPARGRRGERRAGVTTSSWPAR